MGVVGAVGQLNIGEGGLTGVGLENLVEIVDCWGRGVVEAGT